MTVLAAHRWPTNAHLIADVAALGYLRKEWRTLDVTYGEGVFWKRWQPDRLTRTDLDPAKSPDYPGGCDFRSLPFITGAFDAVVFDPPYKLNGTTDVPEPRPAITTDYVPWPAYTPRPWPAATGRWVGEIADAHAAHLRAVAALPDHGAAYPSGVTVHGEQPYVVPSLRSAFRGPA